MSVGRALIILLILVVVVLGALLIPASGLVGAQLPGSPAAATTQRTYTVGSETLAVSVDAAGATEVNEIAAVSFVISGEVAEVLVEEGDYVMTGDPLVRLDDTIQRLAVDTARLNLRAAELELDEVLEVDEDDIRAAEAAIERAQLNLGGVADRVTDEDIRAAELRYQAARRDYDAAVEARRLASGNDEFLASLDADVGEASFELEIARLRLEDLRRSNQAELGAASARVREAEAQLQLVLAGATEFQVESAEIMIDDAQTALADAELDYDRTVLRAPIDGVIATVSTEVGERLTPGVPVITLVDMTPLRVVAEVDEIDIARIEIGMAAEVQVDALPGVLLTGTVTDIAENGVETDGVIEYDVDITLDVVDARLRHGMTADVNIIIDRAQTLAIPADFVDRRRDGAFVTVQQSDGSLTERMVELGRRDGALVEVISGLQAGDVIVLAQN